MNIGRSIRENAERSYWLHCWDVACMMFKVHQWGWRDWWEALCELAGFFVSVVLVIFFPITILAAGYSRKKLAVKDLRRWESNALHMRSNRAKAEHEKNHGPL